MGTCEESLTRRLETHKKVIDSHSSSLNTLQNDHAQLEAAHQILRSQNEKFSHTLSRIEAAFENFTGDDFREELVKKLKDRLELRSMTDVRNGMTRNLAEESPVDSFLDEEIERAVDDVHTAPSSSREIPTITGKELLKQHYQAIERALHRTRGERLETANFRSSPSPAAVR